MSSVGVYLRELREQKGVSLEDMARATRVGRMQLEALEGESFLELPAPVFVKGFIRAYCQFLDTKPDEALDHYRALVGEPLRPGRAVATGRGRAARPLTPIAVSLVLLAVLGGGLLAVHLGGKSGGVRSKSPASPTDSGAAAITAAAPAKTAEMPAPAPTAVERTAAPAQDRTPVPVAGAVAAPPVNATTGQRLMVKAIEPTWLRVTTDRGNAVEETLPVGAVREWSTEKHFVLTVGNAGGLEVTLNGQRLPPLGERGVVIRELVLPSDSPPPRS
jgi:cytoskeleton protein RodZ